jgi:hypothetical protein
VKSTEKLHRIFSKSFDRILIFNLIFIFNGGKALTHAMGTEGYCCQQQKLAGRSHVASLPPVHK